MSARRLCRLLGPALALAALFGAMFVAEEVHTFNQLTFEWVADFATTTVAQVGGSGV
ncbi:hypothetical protein BDK92_4406 [Micromonospora pisi]|uniref:Uncharacterized protein n=1 Tax=Micromonospora pisi TaxID=589240 RepID=A0A495JMI2_9ACTN|nr:hypothetical protein [Micromonospora pisi]RKR90041.1 hypothetical protein BDK92_4406 [Micromonospora pisi]